MDKLVDSQGGFGSANKDGMMHELRFLAYDDVPLHEFSISITDTRNRLMAIEKLWKAGAATSALETAFWNACHARHHQPRCFVAREA